MDGATLQNKGAFIYGGAVALETEIYLSDAIALTASVKERLVWGNSTGHFHTQFGIPFSDIVEKPLSHPALRQYLRERGISADVASRFCCQVEYRYNGKQFFAVGFKNNSDGYEIRNRFFKGCVSPKDITLIGRNSNVCHLYEGFMDFLSAVILVIGRGEDHIVLNSVANMQKVHHLLDGYAQVYCHLDNDEAGENACIELQKRYGDKVIDHSHLYTGYKDLNEYLMSHKTRK